MTPEDAASAEEAELQAAVEAIMQSHSRKKLVIAGPGTGKTTLFKRMLKASPGDEDRRLVVTFINSLRDDLANDLDGLAKVFTLHAYSLGLLHKNAELRGNLSSEFRCCPGLASLIASDWELTFGGQAPQFVGEMRALAEDNHLDFYFARADYYDATDFDDSVYRVYLGLSGDVVEGETYDLVLIDEYQDFNALEAGLIGVLGATSPLVVAGDDDQALYSQLRGASWDYIRELRLDGEFEVFELPYCMRCPEVIVGAVGDVIKKARDLEKLEGRIDKPYKHFPPVKGEDSAKYPKIADVKTSVQSKKANYMGRYIAEAISEIPEEEVEAATRGGFPAALVIVNKPYREQIVEYLEKAGFAVSTKPESESAIAREAGLSIIAEDPTSNLGWRIVLASDRPAFIREVVQRVVETGERLADALPDDCRAEVLAEIEERPDAVEEDREGLAAPTGPVVRITSFEGAKGLSAQHVFIAGLHDGEIPHDPKAIKDLEICKFVVGLTRTRKKCTLIHSGRFGEDWKTPSTFIAWIDPTRLATCEVNKDYWAG